MVWRIIIFSWLVFLVVFYFWWFSLSRADEGSGFVITTFVISWPLFLFGYSFFFLMKMKRPDVNDPVPENLRVAIVVTKTPSEPSEIVRKTLISSLNQDYVHDTWVADEDPSENDMLWYKQNGIKVSCRKDDARYHNDTWPRRKKSKEGNLAYFYDNYGYKNYDVVVHLDADHTPHEGYLNHILRPFSNPKIGYVAAPSVCDTNADMSWSARARMHVEAIFHGPIQSGTNDGWVPICIGSHYAVRTTAVKSIGGIGPELAEDYSTTLLLNAKGWRGVWVYDAKARGEGPHSFVDIIVQDYQWARSLFIIFLSIFPKLFFKLDLRQKIYFTFTQLWYPLSALVWSGSMYLISYALFSGKPPVTISFIEFITYFIPVLLVVWLALFFIRRKKMLRPEYGSVLTWENVLFEFARWPWVLLASLDGLFSVILRRKYVYKVTPKGHSSSNKMSFLILLPYFFIVIVFSLAIVSGYNNMAVFGYYIMAICVAVIYVLLMIIAIVMHIKEIRDEQYPKKKHIVSHSPHITSVFITTVVIILISIITIDRIVAYRNTENRIVDLDRKIYELGLKSDSIVNSLESNNVIENDSTLDISLAGTSTATDILIALETKKIEYNVVGGDNLWNISIKYYGKGYLWKRIWDVNRDIENPDRIYIGDKLNIVIP